MPNKPPAVANEEDEEEGWEVNAAVFNTAAAVVAVIASIASEAATGEANLSTTL